MTALADVKVADVKLCGNCRHDRGTACALDTSRSKQSARAKCRGQSWEERPRPRYIAPPPARPHAKILKAIARAEAKLAALREELERAT